jgi:hypothetical protein
VLSCPGWIFTKRGQAIYEELEAKIKTNREKMETVITSGQEETKTATNYISVELEGTVKNRVVDVSMCRPKETGPPQESKPED